MHSQRTENIVKSLQSPAPLVCPDAALSEPVHPVLVYSLFFNALSRPLLFLQAMTVRRKLQATFPAEPVF